jgi:hypothetical protein
MTGKELLTAFCAADKRTHLVGSTENGVIIALDMEGRLFVVLNGKISNRVNVAAVGGQSTMSNYLNPGGDALWPAPEGTSVGYQYAAGMWRPSPSLRCARFLVINRKEKGAVVEAEVDLINNKGIGIPTIFKRSVSIAHADNSIAVKTTESIRYIGAQTLKRSDARLAPWSLCQFDSGKGCKVVFPYKSASSVWDLYDEPSDSQRTWNGRSCYTATDGSMRYQIAIDKEVPWIEYHDPRKGLKVRRSSPLISANSEYIDIRDASPSTKPTRKGVRYSVYSDVSNFMEIESAGGCPPVIAPGTELTLSVLTRYQLT